jgi:hypothetical protein
MSILASPPLFSGATHGLPRLLLQAEGAVALTAAVAAHSVTGGSWWLFGALFLAPDLAMLGYLAGRRAGALSYNLAHTYILALGLSALGWGLGQPLLVSLGLIWVAHIGFDRMLGYGLKYPDGFKATHLSARA